MVSRFRTRAEQKKILEAVASGQVDILIGTHRVLQKDVKFRELGLVIIDEEQRFGVKHKEAFKAMRATVDVLAMSATPIPRTLYMALTGARDLSVIETAPTNRHPIQTIVKTYDEKVVVDAVHHEIRRGGQVFYLHNRVQTIELVAARLRELVPNLTVGTGHGKMDPQELERVMTEFVAGRYQVLVGTSTATCRPPWTDLKAARMATSVLPKPTSPQMSRSIGRVRSMSAFVSLMALSWSRVSVKGNEASNSFCHVVSSAHAWPGCASRAAWMRSSSAARSIVARSAA
jgi:primosomal protein N'